MSTITVVKKNGVAAIAADTLTRCDSWKDSARYVVNHWKIIEVQASYLAITGPTSAKLALRNYFADPTHEVHLHDVDGIFQTWLKLHQALKDSYFLNPDEDEDDSFESSRMNVLIANAYGIFGVGAHRAVQEFSQFYSCGSGAQYALGAMYAIYGDAERSAEDMARYGVEAAAEFDASTGLPVLSHAVKLLD